MTVRKKKKTALFITRMVRGGAQKVVLDLLKHLNRDKFDLTVITGNDNAGDCGYLEQVPDDVRICQFPSVAREISPLKDFTAMVQLARFFKRERFDILHLHTSKAGVLGAFAGRIAGIKRIIYTPHGHIFGSNAAIPGFSNLPSWKRRFLFRLRRYAYSKCDKLVALSEPDLKEQVDLGLAPQYKFTVIMNGVDINWFRTEVAADIQLQGLVVGSVGRLSMEKGHDILIRAFRKITDDITDAVLLIVGDGLEYEKLKCLANELAVADKVIFTGMTDDVRGYLHKMDVFVLPSRYESQGIALMEAMASGIPAVASDVGGVPGILVDGQNGLLVSPENPDLLAETVLKLLKNNDLAQNLAGRALQYAADNFSLDKMIRSYEALYEDTDSDS